MTAVAVSLPHAPPPPAARVVLVDDTPTLRMLTRLALEDAGFDVVGEAGDGLAGLEVARRLRPDLVLLDLAMPVMDGLEALPLLREALPDAQVVILSGFDRAAMEDQVIDAGAHGYLQKGMSPEEMVTRLRALLPAHPAPAPAPPPTASPGPPPTPEDDRVEQLEQDLEELLYLISHDLSEPVHVIAGFGQRLARRVTTEEEGEFCEFILEATGRLQQLLDDLLAYARAGREELPQELLDCRRLVDGVVAGLGSRLAAGGGRVTVGDLPKDVVANRLVVTQVLHNLLSNALKFVRPGVAPQVTVDAVAGDEHGVVLRVRDNGIGIPADQHERVFQAFTRLHSRERYPGTGIGLAICRRLVERQGGRLWLESDDAGSTFLFELPR